MLPRRPTPETAAAARDRLARLTVRPHPGGSGGPPGDGDLPGGDLPGGDLRGGTGGPPRDGGPPGGDLAGGDLARGDLAGGDLAGGDLAGGDLAAAGGSGGGRRSAGRLALVVSPPSAELSGSPAVVIGDAEWIVAPEEFADRAAGSHPWPTPAGRLTAQPGHGTAPAWLGPDDPRTAQPGWQATEDPNPRRPCGRAPLHLSPPPAEPSPADPAPAGPAPAEAGLAGTAARQSPASGSRLRAALDGLLPESLRGARLDPGRRGVVVIAIVALVAAAVAGFAAWQARPTPEPIMAPAAEPGSASPGAGPVVVVAVAGKVRRPGLVRLAAGSRVADALAAAGGALPGTDLGLLNLARKLVDGEQVPVGVTAAAAPAGAPAGPGAPAAGGPQASGTLLDLNSATAAQFDALPGVGQVLAQRIVDYRTAHGGFRSVDQLREVDGIGETRFQRLKDLVTV